jgi:hypothetical protein
MGTVGSVSIVNLGSTDPTVPMMLSFVKGQQAKTMPLPGSRQPSPAHYTSINLCLVQVVSATLMTR